MLSVVATSVLLGDYNHNGFVDATDYVVWRKGLGTTYIQNDYDVWRAHFGQTAGSGPVDTSSACGCSDKSWLQSIGIGRDRLPSAGARQVVEDFSVGNSILDKLGLGFR
jgi:hypothetical protein